MVLSRFKVSKTQLVYFATMVIPGAILWLAMKPFQQSEDELLKQLVRRRPRAHGTGKTPPLP